MAWYLKGESGATLDEEMREIHTLKINSCELKFSSLAEDLLTWTAATEDATGAGTIVPDAGQIVELYQDANRKFRGYVMAPKVGSKRIKISVVGPWWWMTRIPLTSDQVDATSVTAERANYVFASGSHKTKIEALIARAIVNGVPMIAGTVADIYDTPNMSIAEMNCGQALAELLAWVPDAVAYFDYSGAPGTDPILNIGRRGSFPATTYTLGRDAVIDQEITPRLDLEVAQVKLDYVSRNPTTGLPSWAAQSAGTFVRGKKQIVTVSGPEIVDSLPSDDFDQYEIQTVSSYPSNTFIKERDTKLASVELDFGSLLGGVASSIARWTGFSKGGSYDDPVTLRTATKLRVDGNSISNTNLRYIISSNPPEWVRTQLNAFEIKLIGDWAVALTYTNGTSAEDDSDYPLFQAIVDNTSYDGWATAPASPDSSRVLPGWRSYEVSLWAYNGTAYSSATMIYKPWDYDFVTPPAGLAEGLRLAQNWVPWEGPIRLVSDIVSGDNLLNAKYNLVGTLAACATMETLARNIKHNIFSGRTTIDLGAPARSDFGTLTSRVRRQPRDNIVYL